VLIGAHLRTRGSLLGALERAEAIDADVVQLFTQSPRMWKPTRHAPGELARYREAQAAASVVATFCHAAYLINLATPVPALLERSRATLADNLGAARGMGASGLVVHVGSHLGHGFDPVVGQVVDGLLWALDTAVDPVSGSGDLRDGLADCPILIENTAGSGGSVGRSFEELAVLLERAGAGDALGVCLDTQHLFASGVPFGSSAEADDVVGALDATVGLGALKCLHLNDSKAPFGARVDRHANLGEGTIGEEALGCLIGHPALAAVPAVLEVPGAGGGPRPEDVAAARRVLEVGKRLWEEVWGVAEGEGAAAEWET
jgi:deoxyribonuclease IV